MYRFTQVLYLMDRFNVSDEFYHELSMFLPATPRSYQIKKVRTQQNKSLKTRIHRVQGGDELEEERIEQEKEQEEERENTRIKNERDLQYE